MFLLHLLHAAEGVSQKAGRKFNLASTKFFRSRCDCELNGIDGDRERRAIRDERDERLAIIDWMTMVASDEFLGTIGGQAHGLGRDGDNGPVSGHQARLRHMRLTESDRIEWAEIRPMRWYSFEGGRSIGQQGSESGYIIRDEEHLDGARITLERDGKMPPFAITCGIYGWMAHTRFFGREGEAQIQFDRMKSGLEKILGLVRSGDVDDFDGVVSAIEEFISRFP